MRRFKGFAGSRLRSAEIIASNKPLYDSLLNNIYLC